MRFEIIEAFRGVTTGVVDVVTGSGGGDCGYGFKVNHTYLVYGYQAKGTDVLSTGICSRTRPIHEAEEDLAYARAVSTDAAAGGVVRGEVLHRDRTIDNPDSGSSRYAPVADVAVVVECGGLTYRTKSDRRGRFEILGLAVGTCRVRPELDDREYVLSAPSEVIVRDLRACATTTVVIASNGRIRGRIVDAAGKPLGGVTVDLLSPKGPQNLGSPSAVSSGDGSYELEKVAPGAYQIGVNVRTDFGIGHRPFGTAVYFPGVTTPEQSTAVTLKAGERIEVGDFVLPSDVRFVQVSGIVVTDEGTVAAGAKILVHGDEPMRSRIFSGPLVTNDDGRFVVAIPAGERASLVVEWRRPLPEKPYNWERGDEPAFIADRDRADLRIVVRPIKQ